MKIYVATSWKNLEKHRLVVNALRELGHEVYDFTDESTAFHWGEVDPVWRHTSDDTPERISRSVQSPLAQRAYNADFKAMERADACVYITPCGVSASLEAGWFAGQGRPLVMLLGLGRPETLFNMATHIVTDLEKLRELFQGDSLIS